jgi:tRNA(Ile)-lysidine synthase
VSGGADSSALLILAVEAHCRATAVHIDHGLRPGSENESDAVAALAQRLGAGFEAARVTVQPGPNLEARARAARLSVLGPHALLGHTADDQAETLMLALLRGAGPAGLAGADPRRRPLLGLRRYETHALCQVPFEDPSNDDDSFRRNRVRHQLMPLLDQIAERDLVPVLCRMAALHAEVAGVLDDLAVGCDPTSAAQLAEQPRPVAAHAIRAWWRQETGSAHPPDGAAVDRILAVARGEAVACEIGGGWRVARSGGRLSLVATTGSVTAR